MVGAIPMRRGDRARRVGLSIAVMLLLLLSPVLALAQPFAGIVMDARSGKVLWENNADSRLHPASLTKMLTLYIAFDAIKRGEIGLDTMVRISAKAAAEPPSRLGLRAGQQISMRHLIRAAALKSANDAATAIGEAISGSEAGFARRMDRTAKALGMTRSTFRNAHGLTADGHLSTARDMTLLGRRLFYDFPEYYGLFSRLTEDAGIAKVSNTNTRFLNAYRGADGIKTGYTRAAGFNLTASAERGNKRIIATVFGGKSTAQRNAKISELMEVGFGNAPANTRVAPPPPVSLDQVARATSTVPATPGGAGKTIRLKTTRETSPRPMRRPDLAPPPEMVAAVTSGVAAALENLAQTSEPAATPVPEAVAEAPPVRPEARPEAIAAIAAPVSEDAEAPVPAETAVAEAPLPFAVVEAETDPVVRPEARPQPEVALAAAEAPAPPEAVAVATAAEPQDTQPAPTADPVPDSRTLALAADLPDDLPNPVTEDADALPDQPVLTAQLVVPQSVAAISTKRPRARPGEVVMTADRGEVEAVAVTRVSAEVVTRISTSGGRHWAVTLGKFPNRGAAERALLQTALSESRGLDGALRKVVQRGPQWEATFAGMTQDQADMACRRLQARAIGCFTLGP